MEVSNDFLIGTVNRIQAEKTKSNAEIDQEGFLKILAASLSNPPVPGSGGEGSGNQTDFLGQMLQINLLDQITALTTNMEHTMLMNQQQQALSLVGKEVTVAGEDANLVTGMVEKVRFSQGFASISINGNEYNLSDIIEVGVSSNDE